MIRIYTSMCIAALTTGTWTKTSMMLWSIWTHTRIIVCFHVCVCVYIHIYIYMNIYIYVYICIYINLYVYIYTYHTYIHMHMHSSTGNWFLDKHLRDASECVKRNSSKIGLFCRDILLFCARI